LTPGAAPPPLAGVFSRGVGVSFEDWERRHLDALGPAQLRQYLEGVLLVVRSYRRAEIGQTFPHAFGSIEWDIPGP
jgi:hypothetical protein